MHRLLPTLILSLATGLAAAQPGDTGPGGVGDKATNKVWLRSELIPKAPGALVALWPDSSGNLNNAAQPLNGAQPVVRLWPRTATDSMAVLEFNGATSHMKILNSPDFYLGSAVHQQRHVFITFKTGGDVTSRQVLYKEGGMNRGLCIYIYKSTLYLAAYNAPAWKKPFLALDTVIDRDTRYTAMLSLKGMGSELSAYLDGVLVSTEDSAGTLSGDPTSTDPLIGASDGNIRMHDTVQSNGVMQSFFRGQMSELIVYSGAINNTQRLVVENYLSSKYNIPTAIDKYRFDNDYYKEVAAIGTAFLFDAHWSAKGTGIVRIKSSSVPLFLHLGFGHNGDRIDTLIAVSGSSPDVRFMPRRWRADAVAGDVGSVEIEVDLSSVIAAGLPNTGWYLLVGKTFDPDLVKTTAYELTPATSTNYRAAGVQLRDGDYFTFGTLQPQIFFTQKLGGEFEFRDTGLAGVGLNYVTAYDVPFTYTSLAGTATQNADYLAPSGFGKIPAGQRQIQIVIPVLQDALAEPSENLFLTLKPAQLPSPLIVGKDSVMEFHILDDDHPVKVGFNFFGWIVWETDADIQLEVKATLSQRAQNTVTVKYLVEGTATGPPGTPEDHNLMPGSLTFAPGDSVRSLYFLLRGDQLPEEIEYIQLGLVEPVNANVDTNIFRYPLFTYVILDDETNDLSPIIISDSVIHVSCFGAADGEIHVKASGGVAPYRYRWESLSGLVDTTDGITGLAPGQYILSVTDAKGNFAYRTYTILEPKPLVAAASCLPATCGTENGETLVAVSGGTAPYTITWSGGRSGAAITGLPPGSYQVSVYDMNGCQASDYCTVDNDSLSCDIIIWSGFTPNGDGFNDHWIIDGIENSPSNEVYIYNRWGELVWSGARYDNGSVVWKGTSGDGKDLSEGTYFYVVLLENETRKGWVELSR